MTEDDAIWGYDPSVCRSIGASYRGKTKYNGIPVAIYELDFSEEMNVKKCFCRDKDTCPPHGTYDMILDKNAAILRKNSIFLKFFPGTFDMFRCSGVRTIEFNLFFFNSIDCVNVFFS